MGTKEILEKYGVYSDELYKELTQENKQPLTLNGLTKTEKLACKELMKKIGNENEITLIISRFANECGITRSVIVNALKKLEAAAAIQTFSYGMKGTYIKIINTDLRRVICEEE